jgi:hypothetical protein
VDERRRIIGARALTPYLFNLPLEYIACFRQHVCMINLLDEGDPDLLRQAVWSCYDIFSPDLWRGIGAGRGIRICLNRAADKFAPCGPQARLAPYST